MEEIIEKGVFYDSMFSILTSIKKLVGITEEYEAFDTDIIMHINMAIAILEQIGVGKPGFRITDETQTWADYMNDDPKLELVKDYIYLKVRLIFDPPVSTSAVESMNRLISEYEARLYYVGDGAFDKEGDSNE